MHTGEQPGGLFLLLWREQGFFCSEALFRGKSVRIKNIESMVNITNAIIIIDPKRIFEK